MNAVPIEPIYLRAGVVIYNARRAAGMTQTVLAQKSGLSQTALARIESGKVRVQLHQLERFAQILGLSLNYVTHRIFDL